jgi:hypothetical protein
MRLIRQSSVWYVHTILDEADPSSIPGNSLGQCLDRSSVISCKTELEAHSFLCTTENLYTVNGDRLFILVATPPHTAEVRVESLKRDRPSPSEPSPQKRILQTRNPAGTSRPRTIPQFSALLLQC